ncbi:unnamed protein product [Paramecium sonneborni]|uniref:MORN repeat protein n=1 Tax=Paramecium sonneborni TaxID=65129 RepID=A0A8S1MBI8_9CILI|nr:unnamed protein product [Paramecium sonneborni]
MQNQEKFTQIDKISNNFSNDTNDEISQSIMNSPQVDIRYQEVLKKMQSKKIRQLYNDLGPVYEINEKYEIRNFDDESCYFGVVENEQKSGPGILVWFEVGNILDGIWVNNELNGFSRMIYSNGDIFECDFKFGKANGFGVFQSKSKVVKGLWINNVLNGEGQEIRNDGLKYYGQFKDGQKSGRGILYYKDGCKYEGEMNRNKINGKGTFIWNDQSYYEGEFRNGIIDGYGVYVSGNGNSISGYFQEESKKDRIQRIQSIDQNGIKKVIEKIRQL